MGLRTGNREILHTAVLAWIVLFVFVVCLFSGRTPRLGVEKGYAEARQANGVHMAIWLDLKDPNEEGERQRQRERERGERERERREMENTQPEKSRKSLNMYANQQVRSGMCRRKFGDNSVYF